MVADPRRSWRPRQSLVPAATAPRLRACARTARGLLAGGAASAALSRKLAAAPWASFLPQLAVLGGFTASLWALLLP